MPKRKKGAQVKAREAAETARPYVQRLIEDEDLRENIRDAYGAARSAYMRASNNGGAPAKALLDDKKVQKDLKAASESLAAAAEALREPQRRPRRLTFGRLLLIAFIGAVLAIALSEDIRKALLDRLFGAEEEFEYSSTTAPPAAQPSSTG